MNRGYIRLWRQIQNSNLWPKGRPFTKLEAWIDLTLMAKGTNTDTLKRGQLEASVRFLARRWLWSVSTTHRFLQSLVKDGSIRVEHQTEHLAEHITICKYGTFNPLAERKVEHQTEQIKESIKEGLNKSPNGDSPSPKTLLEIFNTENQLLPTVKAFSEGRKGKCRSRINRASKGGRLEPYLKDFREAVRMAQRIPFLVGQNDRKWKAHFDWFIANDDNIYGVLEGKYGEPRGGVNVDLG